MNQDSMGHVKVLNLAQLKFPSFPGIETDTLKLAGPLNGTHLF